MADENQVTLLRRDVAAWNQWRSENSDVRVDLLKADLSGADLHEVDLKEANLNSANLSGANLNSANLSGANLNSANLILAHLRRANLCRAYLRNAKLMKATLTEVSASEAYLRGADLTGANLAQADLSKANLKETHFVNANLSAALMIKANLSRADLSAANLKAANLGGATLDRGRLINTDFRNANLTGCQVYGISTWGLHLEGAIQTGLRITPFTEPEIVVDDLEVAQFLYLMLHNDKIRQIIDSITSKVVLILGRFTEPRKQVLDALRDELRLRNYLPVVFDFEKPASRDLTETVSTLAHMARFVIADLTDAKSIPQELSAIIPNLPSVAVQPLIQADDAEYGMFERWRRFPWVLDTYRYENRDALLSAIKEHVIDPAEQRANEIAPLTS